MKQWWISLFLKFLDPNKRQKKKTEKQQKASKINKKKRINKKRTRYEEGCFIAAEVRFWFEAKQEEIEKDGRRRRIKEGIKERYEEDQEEKKKLRLLEGS